MALEDLTGTKTIDAMDPANPAGGDAKSEGDNHIAGIKNVILNTFPNITGAVTLTHTQINESVFASGTVALFFQAAAPTYWTQVTALNDYMLRIVNTAGGGNGGTNSPILLDSSNVPSHIHHVALTTNADGAHIHDVQGIVRSGPGSPFLGTGSFGVQYGVTIQTDGAVAHTHAIDGDSAGNTSAANWTPKYINIIQCSKN